MDILLLFLLLLLLLLLLSPSLLLLLLISPSLQFPLFNLQPPNMTLKTPSNKLASAFQFNTKAAAKFRFNQTLLFAKHRIAKPLATSRYKHLYEKNHLQLNTFLQKSLQLIQSKKDQNPDDVNRLISRNICYIRPRARSQKSINSMIVNPINYSSNSNHQTKHNIYPYSNYSNLHHTALKPTLQEPSSNFSTNKKNQDMYPNYQNPSPPTFILGDSRQLNQLNQLNQSNNTNTATTLIPNPVLSTLTTTPTMTLPPFQQFYRNQQGQLYSPLYYFYCSNNNTYYYYYYYIVSVSGCPVNLTAVPQTKISPSALVKPHDATYAAANVQ